MEAKHTPTPGPWTFSKRWKSHGFVVSAAGAVLCAPHTEANARLIAAAPDLLDALLTSLPFVEDAMDDPVFKDGAVSKRLATIRAALTKAGAL